MESVDISLRVADLGRMGYARALAEQRRINQAVIDQIEPATLLLLEHDPVITVSHRKSAPGHLVASADQLAKLGIGVEETDRGGDITYHGPGQLVAYPIIPLTPHRLNLSRYMRLLEHVVIQTLATFNIQSQRDPSATGVWTPLRCELRVAGSEFAGAGDNSKLGTRNSELAKIAAMGVRVRKNTTMHGLALNVTTDLSHFQTIVPCGLAGRPVTSMQKLLGQATPSMQQVKDELSRQMKLALSQAAAGVEIEA